MARKRVDAPSARIQRNLLQPVDTYFQSKTGVVVQPGDQSDSLLKLKQALKIAERDNEEREEKWNKEQQTLGTKAAMEAMAKDPNLLGKAATEHPSKSYQFQMAYDGKSGELNAINFGTKLREEFDALQGSVDSNGILQPPNYQEFVQKKVAEKMSSLGDNQFYIGGFQKHLNQLLPQMYAESTARSRKIKKDGILRATHELSNSKLNDISKTDKQKITDVWLEYQKMPGQLSGIEKKDAFIKTILSHAESTNNEKIVAELLRMTDNGTLVIPNSNGQPFKLTPTETEGLKKKVREIYDEGHRKRLQARQIQKMEKDDALIVLGNDVDNWDWRTVPAKNQMATIRTKLGVGGKYITDEEILKKLDTYRSVKIQEQNTDFRSPAVKNSDHVKLHQKITELFKTGEHPDSHSAAMKAVSDLGLHLDVSTATTVATKIWSAEGKAWASVPVSKFVPKVFGENALTGKPSGLGKNLQDMMNAHLLDLDKNDGAFAGKTYDLQSAKGRADAIEAIKTASLIELVKSDEKLSSIAYGPDHPDHTENSTAGGDASNWNSPPFAGVGSRADIYRMLVENNAIPEGWPRPGATPTSPRSSARSSENQPQATQPATDEHGYRNIPVDAPPALRTRLEAENAERASRIRPDQFATIEETRGSGMSRRAVEVAQNLNLDPRQLQAAANDLLSVVPQAETRRGRQRIPAVNPDDPNFQRERILNFFDAGTSFISSPEDRARADMIVKTVLEYMQNLNDDGG